MPQRCEKECEFAEEKPKKISKGSSVLHHAWDSEMKQFGRKLTELWPKEVFGLKDPHLIFGFWAEKES